KTVPVISQSQIEILDARRLPVRLGIVVAVAIALVFGWFAIRWQLGNMLAEHTAPTDVGAKDKARIAADFAPRDPLANWLLVNTDGNSASKNNTEQVVKLSPFDFRWWIELGREREQAEQPDGAEKALQKAVELAPNYTFPRWQLGNFYLRQNRSDEAFRQLSLAAQTNALYREQVFSLAWEYFEQDTARLEQIAGGSPEVRAALAKFYALKGRAADSLRLWNSLSEEEKEANSDGARIIAQALYDKQSFREAVEFVRQLGIEPDAKAETVQNGSFERPIGEVQETYFGWKISPIEKMNVKLDPMVKHEGNRSLRVAFNGYAQPTLQNISQIVTVEPRARYRLSFWVRTENLKSGGAPNLEIYNIADAKSVAVSASFPVGTNDWQQVKIEFTAPPNAEAVTLRTTRLYCGDVCPIFGTFWYDDFRLEKLK
ncbi:MAG: carbohydrate binding domain-containing protein, partial [Acidobacteriota bacterium]|nr:carbohydrate binding domain-containing protein [Acidobacteriota bacterium]